MGRFGIALMAAATLVLAGAATAFACTNLATLNLGASSGSAGSTVDVTGSSFATGDDAQEVVIHWDGVEGPELATVQPDESGGIATSVAIPEDAEAGYHVLVATQMTQEEGGHEAEGLSPAFGTPARATFLVGSEPAEAAPAEASTGGAPTAETSSGLLALLGLLGVAGIGLFSAGLGLFVREVRQRRATPAPAPRE